MNHRSASKAHIRTRMMERYGKYPSMKELDDMRIALKTGQCFFRQDCGSTIRGIVSFRNIHVSAVYNKAIDGMVTVGCPLTGERR